MIISKILVLSTAHMRQSTDVLLNEMSSRKESDIENHELPRFIKKTEAHHYGHVFFLQGDNDIEELKEELEIAKMCDLLPVFKYALKNDCSFIDFDRDAEIIEGLPQYKW